MNRLLSGAATIALCAFWASGCASPGLDDKSAAPAPLASDSNPTIDPDADTASLEKTLPTDLPGEIERAHLLRERGAYDEAAKSLAQIMLVAPDDPRVVAEYGKTLLQSGRTQEAVSFLKRASQLSPSDWTIYSAMGVALDQTGDHTNAKLAYQRALTLEPGEPTVLNNLAISRALSGDVSGAKTILANASKTGTDQPKIANNVAAVDAMQKPAAPAPAITLKPVETATVIAPKPVTQAALPPAPVKTASVNTAATAADEKKLGSGVVMQSVPVDPKAGPVGASRKPAPLVDAAPKMAALSVNTAATAADEKKLGPGVVMQAVPVDPKAGPMAAQESPRKLAAAKPAKKPLAKPASPTVIAAAKPALKTQDAPALRTASDTN
jgi:Flp pilus assembly protein TadD